MLVQSAWVLDTPQEAPLGPCEPHRLPVDLERGPGHKPRDWATGRQMQRAPAWEASHSPARRGKGCMCRGWGRGTHELPSILSEEIVLKFAKFLSNPLLFFSHFLKVFQEFWPKRGGGAGREENRVKSELS